PGQFGRILADGGPQGGRPTPPMSKELPKWAAMRGNSARRVLRNGQKGVRFRSGWETTGGAPERTRPGTPARLVVVACAATRRSRDRKSTRLNSSHVKISYAVFCLKKKRE